METKFQSVVSLPYDRSNPVVYDNDDHRDAYTDEYLMALASAGEIQLKGIITSYPYDKAEYEEFCVGRGRIVETARRSGLRNIPDAVKGPFERLTKPRDGKIEDTVPINTEGSRLVCTLAKAALPQKPLVLITGGPLTVAADAYLLDNSIADRLIVASLCASEQGMFGWNSELDIWASFIVLERLKYVQFPESNNLSTAASVPKSKLAELPDCEFRQWMIEKHHPENGGPWEHDADGQPAIPLMRPDYCIEAKYVSFRCFQNEVPVFRNASSSNAILVTKMDSKVATEEFWRAVKNPKAYHMDEVV